MGLKKLAGKLVDYKQRYERGQAEKIKPKHVSKVMDKLTKKVSDLEAEISSAKSADKQARLKTKLKIAREHVERAEWLMKQIK